MKKTFRILAVVLAATMLMCCCAFALDYGCTCASRYSSAYSSGDDPEAETTIAGFAGGVTLINGGWIPVGDSSSTSGSSYASCRETYSIASAGAIDSHHYIDGNDYYDYDEF